MLDINPKMILLEIAALSAVLLLAWQFSSPPKPYVPADVAPQVSTVPTVAVPMAAPIKVYAPAAKAKLSLPAAIVAAPNKHVAAATRIKPDQHPQTIITVVDTSTGDIETSTRKEPFPWIAINRSGHVQLGTGFNRDMSRVSWLAMHQNVVQIKRLHAGLDAAIFTDGQRYAGATITWRW